MAARKEKLRLLRSALACLFLILGCGEEPAGKDPKAPASEGHRPLPRPDTTGKEFVAIPGTGVSLPRPQGFADAAQFAGFLQETTGASVLVTSLPFGFAKLAPGLTADEMGRRGMILKEKTDGTLEGNRAALLEVAQQAAGRRFKKWMLVVGDDEGAAMVTATFPEENAAELSDALRDTVLSTRWSGASPGPSLDGLGFAIAADGLKLAQRMGPSLVFTRDGSLPVKEPGEPKLVATRSVGPAADPDRDAFARWRLGRLDEHLTDLADVATKRVMVDGLEGVEATATGKHAGAGVPLFVYQLILFEPEGYFAILGLVGRDGREEFEPVFRRMAQSLQRR